MLKSTYKPSPNAPPPLPPGWTEHKAPTGHTYYYHAETKTSTYTRPGAPAPAAPAPAAMDASTSFMQHHAVPGVNLADPRVANAFMAQYNNHQQPPTHHHRGGGGRGGRGGGAHGDNNNRPRPQPTDKPRSKEAIPGHEPWILVYTKYGRRFAYNPAKNASYWRIPDKLRDGILELDKARIRQKAGVEEENNNNITSGATTGKKSVTEGTTPAVEQQESENNNTQGQPEDDEEEEEGDAGEGDQHDYDSSEYEEVEVTDDEGEDDDEHAPKRQRTDEDPAEADQPVEFSEADIMAQLQAMGEDYGLEQGEYDDGQMDEWPEGAAGMELTEEDARALFKDLLNDYRINPYSPWEKLIEEGKVIDDSRYTVLSTTRERKEVWEEWSREKIKELKEQRAKEEKKDPKIPYLAFLQDKATPKLYWPEFKRKYKREPAMKDMALPEKDKEKLYREHINRLKMPQATLKADFAALLKSAPLSQLNNQTLPSQLPSQIMADIRYISLDPKTRDALVETYLQTLGPPPGEDGDTDAHDEASQKALELRRKREKALRDRERAVEEEKRRQDKKLQHSRAMLREGERELEAAMEVGKRGLQSQLAGSGAKGD